MRFHKLTLGLLLAIATVGQQLAATAYDFKVPTRPNLSDFKATQSEVQRAAQNTSATRFKVRLENISSPNEFTASNGMQWTLDFSPGVWLVHNTSNPLFNTGQNDRGQGLKAIAEDGDPTQLATSLPTLAGIQASGVFNTAIGAVKPGGIRPGQVFEFTINARPGQKLSIATMFGQSNDWFYAPSGDGIALFDANGRPISGDVTSQIKLWDDGTEADEEPGIGLNQGPRQKMTNSGPADSNASVRLVDAATGYANASNVMRITITPE